MFQTVATHLQPFRLAAWVPAGLLLIAGSMSTEAQSGSQRSTAPEHVVVDDSHRMLPADADALMRLRERTELLRALGIAPRDSRSPGSSRPQRPDARPETLSPGLLELLRQMAPQSLPKHSENGPGSEKRGISQTPSGSSQNGTNDSRGLERLQDLLTQDNLTPPDVREIQELMRSSGNASASEPLNRSRQTETGSPPDVRNSTMRPARPVPGGSSLPGATPLPRNNRQADDEARHSARQEMLRRALGIEPDPQQADSDSTPGSGLSSSNPSGLPTRNRTRSNEANRQPEPSPGTAAIDGSRPAAKAASRPAPRNQRSDSRFDATAGQNARTGTPASTGRTPTQQNPGPVASRNPERNRIVSPMSPQDDSRTQEPTAVESDGEQTERSKRLSEIARSNQPAWQKLQRIAQFARQEASQRSASQSSDSSSTDDNVSGLSGGLTKKLADVVQSAAQATAETVTEIRNQTAEPDRRDRSPSARQNESPGGIRNWTSSVNEWITGLPDESDSAAATSEPTRSRSENGNEPAFGSTWWVAVLLLGGGTWWLFRRRLTAIDTTADRQSNQHQLQTNATERERLIHAFHELIRQSKCGSQEWWHHSRAVQQLATRQPQIATAVRALAAIYEQARYAPESDPSPEQLAAARVALKRCGKR